jgi:hypothetical protein
MLRFVFENLLVINYYLYIETYYSLGGIRPVFLSFERPIT